jgi:molybdopterin-binding protein
VRPRLDLDERHHAVEELGLAPGVPATAAVKATSVMVERGGS